MPVAEKINELTARKRLLVAESELNRETLTVELCALSQRTAPFERWALLGWKTYPIFHFGLRVAKSLAAGKGSNKPGGRLSIISRGLEFASAVLRALRPSP